MQMIKMEKEEMEKEKNETIERLQKQIDEMEVRNSVT